MSSNASRFLPVFEPFQPRSVMVGIALGIGTMLWMGGSVTGRAAERETYFRSDRGVSDVRGPLPVDLGKPELLKWRVPMPSGHSTPVRAGGRLFLTRYDGESRQLSVVALRETDGAEVWKKVVPSQGIEPFHTMAGSPAAASPAVDNERLYVFFGSFGLMSLDFDGNTVWDKPMGPFRNEYGASSSPVLVGDKLILLQDHDLGSFLIALDSKTGKEIWRVDRPDAVRSYSTPAVWNHEGKVELLVAGALELAGYDPNTGERKWWTAGLARIVIPTPVPVGDRILMASWAPGGDAGRRLTLDPWDVAVGKWDANNNGQLARNEIDNPEVLDRFFRMDLDQSGELSRAEWERHAEVFRRAQNAVLSIRPGSTRGALSEDAIMWKHTRGVPYVASPVANGGVYWMVKDGGIVTKLEVETGALIQEERLPAVGSYYASPVIGDGKVYFASESGVVTVMAEGREWKVLGSHDFKEKIHAAVVPGDRRVYVRTQKAVYAIGE